MKESTVLEILDKMNQLIYSNLKKLALEQYYPGADPDRMDDIIKHCKVKHKALTRIRAEFEIVCSDAIIKEGD